MSGDVKLVEDKQCPYFGLALSRDNKPVSRFEWSGRDVVINALVNIITSQLRRRLITLC